MPGRLTFPLDKIKALAEQVRAAKEHRPEPYGDGQTGGPALWCVGDQGVYLMGNNDVFPEGARPTVVYANECNPETMEFDDWYWYDAKRDIFGGDDGVDALPLADIEAAVQRAEKAGKVILTLVLTADHIAFV